MDETTAIACAGGKGKGWLAIDIALRYANPGFKVADKYEIQRRDLPSVLYLDWEENSNETARRFQWMANGLGISVPTNIVYRRMKRPLVEEINMVRAEAVRRNVGLVIVDSLAPASGGQIKDEKAVIEAMEAIRDLSPATRCVIGHVTKADARNESSRPTMIGSGFYEYLVRSYWEMQAEAYGLTSTIALLHRKANVGPLQENIALKLQWKDADCMAYITLGDIRDVSVAMDHLDIRTKMLYALEAAIKDSQRLAIPTSELVKRVKDLDSRDPSRQAIRLLKSLDSVEQVNPGQKGKMAGGGHIEALWRFKNDPWNQDTLPPGD